MHQIGKYILNEVMPAPYLLTNPKYYYGLESMRFKRKRPMDEGILLSMPWHHNFYHWMIEMLPRLISYDRCPQLQHVPLIVPKSAPKFVAESLRLTGYQSKTIFLENGAYRFKKLHMLSKLASTTEVSPDAVEWLNKKFNDTSSTLIGPKKIYVSRRDAKIRFVANETQLADILSEFGFETFVMSDLSLADQINLFRTAEFIVGPHGAAFANLAFSKPGATFIEFFSRGHYAPCFNRISGIRGLKYGFLVGEPTVLGGFSINPNHLRAILLQALQPNSEQKPVTVPFGMR
jgi:capsular polysaccharide biosynthesis protein